MCRASPLNLPVAVHSAKQAYFALEGFILFCGFVVGKLLLRLASLGSDGGHPSIELAFAVPGADDPGGISNVCAHRAALVEEDSVDASHAIE